MNFEPAVAMIESARSILLTTHVRPDGDAVGSLVALKNLIEKNAQKNSRPCQTRLLFLSKVPAHYRFILTEPPWEESNQIHPQPIAPERLDPFDLIIVVDTSAARQLPGLSDYLTEHPDRVLVIDHHPAGDGIGSVRLIDARAAAVGQIIFDLAQFARWPLDPLDASALFVAVSTDTGWFRFDNATARTYEVAAKLVAAGAKPDQIYRELFQKLPPERLKLLAMTLTTLELHCRNRLAVMHITRDMLARSGAKRSHIENMVNEAWQIDDVSVSALLVEQDDGTTRVSLRSRGPVDVNLVAQQFDGGGHANAAGATLHLPLDQTRQKILDALTTALAQTPPLKTPPTGSVIRH